MRKRRIMAMTLAAVMAASLTACGGPDKGHYRDRRRAGDPDILVLASHG